MTGVPSSTWFSAAPHWEWFIALYFFLGGLAGGSYFLSALIDLFGSREHRPLAHLGYYVAFPCLALSGLLLAVDLGRPLRAWHMFIQSNTYRPMFKYWSPMSIGSWALAADYVRRRRWAASSRCSEDFSDSTWPATRESCWP